MDIDPEKAGLAFTAIAGGLGAMWGVWRSNKRDDLRQQADAKKASDDAAFDRLNHYCDRQQTQIDTLIKRDSEKEQRLASQQQQLDECAAKHEECEDGRKNDREQAEATHRALQRQIDQLKGNVQQITNGGSL